MVGEIQHSMEGLSPKKVKSDDLDLNKISTMKRVSDLFPKGFTAETSVNNLPSKVTKLIPETSVTKNIPNLTQSSLPVIPQNSIASDVTKHNRSIENFSKHQVQRELVKRFKPFNIITILLVLGWMITVILLNVL
jgi:hypothetical protein